MQVPNSGVAQPKRSLDPEFRPPRNTTLFCNSDSANEGLFSVGPRLGESFSLDYFILSHISMYAGSKGTNAFLDAVLKVSQTMSKMMALP